MDNEGGAGTQVLPHRDSRGQAAIAPAFQSLATLGYLMPPRPQAGALSDHSGHFRQQPLPLPPRATPSSVSSLP